MNLRKVWDILDLKNIDRLKYSQDALLVAWDIFAFVERQLPKPEPKEENDCKDTECCSESMKGDCKNGNGEGNGEHGNINDDGSVAEGDEAKISKGSHQGGVKMPELSDRQKEQLKKAIKKQEDFQNGEIKKKKLSKKDQNKRMESLLDEFGLTHIRKNRGDLLSGGERRRTEIARALATDPSFILLDEPFAGVDPLAVEDIQKIITKLTEKNIGILITDHNVRETLAITDRTYLMFEGNILKDGKPEELADDETVRKVYLGQNFELRKKS